MRGEVAPEVDVGACRDATAVWRDHEGDRRIAVRPVPARQQHVGGPRLAVPGAVVDPEQPHVRGQAVPCDERRDDARGGGSRGYQHARAERRLRAAPSWSPPGAGCGSPRANPAPPATTAANATTRARPAHPPGRPSPKRAIPATIGTALVNNDARPAVEMTPPR